MDTAFLSSNRRAGAGDRPQSPLNLAANPGREHRVHAVSAAFRNIFLVVFLIFLFAVVQTLTTQIGARTGAVDPKTGVVYLPTATYTLQGGIPTVTPGTFQVLVVSPG